MRSLRRRLLLGISVATTGTLIAASIAIFLIARASLVAQFDAVSFAKSRALAALVEYHKGKIRIEESPEAEPPEFSRAKNPEYFQIWLADGTDVFKSKSLPPEKHLALPIFTAAHPSTHPVTLPDGRAGRQSFGQFFAFVEDDEKHGPAPRIWISVARDTADLDRMLNQLRWLLTLVCGVATAVVLTSTTLVIRQGLQPVNRLATDISGIGEQSLAGRLSMEGIPKELSPVVLRLNDLLARLQGAFDREQSFTADAAHELRTPLAGLEAALDVCARKARTPEAYAVVVTDCLGVVRDMHSMIDNLLLLARADAQELHAASTMLRIDELMSQTWQRFQRRAQERSLQVSWNVPDGLSANSDRDKLLHVLMNIFDNATRYADIGGTVAVLAQRLDRAIEITVSNSGSRISRQDVAHVFERFWRADPVRSEAASNAGLGLSVCQKMMAAIGGSIDVESELAGQFTVRISIAG